MAPSSSWMTAEFQQARQQAAEEARAQHATLLRRQRLQMATADVLQLPSVAKPTQPKVGSAGSTATHISADARNASSSSTPSPAVASAEMHNAAGAPALTTNGPLPASRRAPSRASAAVNPPSRLGLGSHKMPALGGGRHAAPATAHGHSSAQMHGTGSVSPGRASPYLVRNQHKTSISSSGAANGAQRAPATSPGKRSALSRDGSASPSSPVRPPATRSMRVDTVTAHNRIITPPMKAKDESLPSVPEGSGKEQHDCKAEGTKPGATEMSPTHPKSQTLLARLLRPKNPKSKGMGSPKP